MKIILFLRDFIRLDFHCRKLHEKEVTVAVTPNGYADALTQNPDDGKEYFVMPEEVNMQMSDFLHALDDKT